jgi:Asp/Glu/hydantoin racemase
MAKRLALIHTVTSLTATFNGLCGELIPDVSVFHIADESLIQNTIQAGKVTPTTARRLFGYMVSAEEAGADMILVTCSSVGRVVEMVRPFLNIPAVRVDEAMADLAVRTGPRIGVAATLSTTLGPTADLIRARAAAHGKQAMVTDKLVEGAFQALLSGDTARHDALVSADLKELAAISDVIVLAQASMARVADALPESVKGIPILSSPRLAIERVAGLLRG